MHVHLHFTTSGAGGSGSSFMSFSALSCFASQLNTQRTRIILIDANTKNHDNYDSWLAEFATSAKIQQTLVDTDFHLYQLHNGQHQVQVVRIDKLSWDWIYELVNTSNDSTDNNVEITYIIIDSHHSFSTLINSIGLPNIPEGNTWSVFPWLLWTANIFGNREFFGQIQKSLDDVENHFHAKGWRFIPIHVFNPVFSDTNIDQGSLSQRLPRKGPDAERVTSYNVYRVRPAGEFIATSDFFSFAFAYIPSSVAVVYEEKEVYEQVGKMLNNHCCTSDRCESGHGKAVCRNGNIFCISTYDRYLGKLKTVPRTARELAERAGKEAAKTPSPLAPVMKLRKVLGRVGDEVCWNLDAFYKLLG